MTNVQKIGVSALLAMSFLAGCGSSSDDNTTDKKNVRYVSDTIGSDTILTDKTTNLKWVNSAAGCSPQGAGSTQSQTLQVAKNFCLALNFGGFDDWRVPTASEVKELEIKTDEESVQLFYQNPACPRILGLIGDNNITSINTTNVQPVGTDVGFKLNAGIRCVRN